MAARSSRIVAVASAAILAVAGAGIFRWYLRSGNPPLPHWSREYVLPPRPAGVADPLRRVRIKFPPTPTAEQRVQVFRRDFRLLTSFNALPETARAFFMDEKREHVAMADPGQPWQIGCVGNGKLPMERLVFAGVSNEFAFVHYEFGGIAHGHRIEVYRITSSGWRPAWSQYLPSRAENLYGLRRLMAASEPCCATTN